MRIKPPKSVPIPCHPDKSTSSSKCWAFAIAMVSIEDSWVTMVMDRLQQVEQTADVLKKQNSSLTAELIVLRIILLLQVRSTADQSSSSICWVQNMPAHIQTIFEKHVNVIALKDLRGISLCDRSHFSLIDPEISFHTATSALLKSDNWRSIGNGKESILTNWCDLEHTI